jgi:dUTP pyrophosphatase
MIGLDARKMMRFSRIKGRFGLTPIYGTTGSVGLDFFMPMGYDMTVMPHHDALIPTGIVVEVPEGHALIAFNKSGVASKQKLVVGACVIDEDYRGEVHIHVINTSDTMQMIKAGQKLAQFILLPYATAKLKEVPLHDLSITSRGASGFGSTGL